ncbi:MAG: hypothetical protein ABI895_11715 [Deltaproteobacteria bacterium]
MPSVACSADELVTLGRATPDPLFGDEGRPVDGLNDSSDQSAPSLSEDLLEIYFTSIREGTGKGDIWCARRSTRTAAFDKAELVKSVSTTAQEVSPVISRDGLTLWIGSDREGSVGELDIWQAERGSRTSDWGELRNVTELNSVSDDIPRPLAQGELVMPFASRRDGAEYQTYLAHRPSSSSAFGPGFERVELQPEEGGGINGGFLTEDGRLLFFDREGSPGGDLYLAWRRSSREPFPSQNVIKLERVNTSALERDPWLSADQTRFFFASSRLTGRGFDIFATTLDLPVFE